MKYKRLTKKFENGYVIADCSTCPSCNKCDDRTHYCQTTIKERLAELEDELENGKVVRLPCKVGDAVYKILYVFGDRKIVQFKVSKISIDEKEILIFFRKSKKGWQEWCTKPQHFGSNVFLTREEAEKRLKELQK